MDICQEISTTEYCYAKMATRYVHAAKFGRATTNMLYQMLQLKMYLNALKRCVPDTVIEKTKNDQDVYSCTEVTLDICLDELEIDSLVQKIIPFVSYSNQYNNAV